MKKRFVVLGVMSAPVLEQQLNEMYMAGYSFLAVAEARNENLVILENSNVTDDALRQQREDMNHKAALRIGE